MTTPLADMLLVEPARLGPEEVAGMPEPARRYLATAILAGAPLATSARLRMRGWIRGV